MKTNSARRGLLAASVVAVMSIACAIWLSSESSPATAPHSAVDAAPEPRLNLGLRRWVEEMNSRSAAYDVEALSIVNDKSTCQIWCTTLYNHGPFVRYLVSHRDGTINELAVFAGGNGTPNSGAKILLNLLILVTALAGDPDDQSIPAATAALTHDLTERGSADATISGVHYTAQLDHDTGIVIVATR